MVYICSGGTTHRKSTAGLRKASVAAVRGSMALLQGAWESSRSNNSSKQSSSTNQNGTQGLHRSSSSDAAAAAAEADLLGDLLYSQLPPPPAADVQSDQRLRDAAVQERLNEAVQHPPGELTRVEA